MTNLHLLKSLKDDIETESEDGFSWILLQRTTTKLRSISRVTVFILSNIFFDLEANFKTESDRSAIFLVIIFFPVDYRLGAVWPDLAKFRHFGKTLQVFGNFWQFISHLHKMLCQLRQIYDIIGQIFIVANGQILKNNITIWPNWSLVPNRSILVRL